MQGLGGNGLKAGPGMPTFGWGDSLQPRSARAEEFLILPSLLPDTDLMAEGAQGGGR